MHDVSQIHHSPQHSDAAIQALFDTGRRAAFGYFESAGARRCRQQSRICLSAGRHPHQETVVLLERPARPHDHGRRGLSWAIRPPTVLDASGASSVFRSRRTSSRRSASARSWTRSPRAQGGTGHDIGIGPDNLFIHMTGMSDAGWQAVKDAGAQVSLAVPIEMNMRHGMPPILRMQSLGMEPSLSVDVECTMTADFFTQMRVGHEHAARARQPDDPRAARQSTLPNLSTGGFRRPPATVADAERQSAGPAHDARRAALRHHERRQGAAARQQDRLAHARQGGRHHHPRRHQRSTWRRSTRCRARWSR